MILEAYGYKKSAFMRGRALTSARSNAELAPTQYLSLQSSRNRQFANQAVHSIGDEFFAHELASLLR